MNQPKYQRAMLTAISYYRLFTMPVDDDISNITTGGPDISPEILDEIQDFAKRFFEKRGVKPFQPKESDFPAYATTKAGANGPSAMALTSLKDILALENNNLLQKIIDFSYEVYKDPKILIDNIEESLTRAKSLVDINLQSLKTGRLHLLAEGGGKTRVICIPDIWTQSVLKPIHQYLMDHCLKRMPCDGSFGHEVLGNKVKKFTKHRGLHCFDLTAATDRFPLSIQKAVLTPLLGERVHAWADLMVNRSYSFKSKEIRYAVGQPMGLLTSWAAFSLSHHVIINYCKEGDFYAMIGDDMGMSSEEGAKRYKDFMTSIGVSINDSKSLIPYRGNKVAEIAKRQFSAGIEISPIPPRVLVESTKSLEGLLEFLQVLASRTGKFQDLSELERINILRLVRNNKEFDTDKFQVTLTCPLVKYNPFGIYIELLGPLVKEVTSKWNTSMPVQTYQHEMERYILDIAVNAINNNPLTLESLGIIKSPGASQSQSFPLIESYLKIRSEDLKRLLRESQAHQGSDDWDDDHVTSPESVYEEIVSGPDPNSPKDFMEKRRIRRKQTIDLLYKYYSQSRFARMK